LLLRSVLEEEDHAMTERVLSRRAEARGRFDYRPSKRVIASALKPKSRGGLQHRPREAKRPRNISRRVLIAACLEEYRSDEGGAAALYSSLLIRELVRIEPDLAEKFGLAALEN
jgi:hypothetical protein